MNKINFYFQSKRKIKLDKLFLRRAILDIVRSENVSCSMLNIVLCNDEYVKELNIKYLKHNFLTDILTFDYSNSSNLSGEIYISLDRVKENSEKYKRSFENELTRVIFHGILHLCGYKDKSKIEKKEMTAKEDFYLATLINKKENAG